MQRKYLTLNNNPKELTDSIANLSHRVDLPRTYKNGRCVLSIHLINSGGVTGNYSIEASMVMGDVQSDFFTLKSSTALTSGSETSQQLKLHTTTYANNKWDDLADAVIIKVTKVSGSTTLNYYGNLSFS